MLQLRAEYNPVIPEIYWGNIGDSLGYLEVFPSGLEVSNATQGIDLILDVDYTVDWVNQSIIMIQNATAGDILNISVYEVGGGSQLYRANYTGVEVDQTVIIPVNSAEIYDVAVFVNGAITNGVTWEPYIESTNWNILDTYAILDIVNHSGVYYRALQDVPVGIAIDNPLYWLAFVPTLQSLVDLGTEPGSTDGVA